MKIALKNLRWIAPKVFSTSTGMQTVTSAPATEEFLQTWKEHKGVLLKAGVSLKRIIKTGEDRVIYARPLDTATAVEASRAHTGKDSKGRKLEFRAPEGLDYLPFQQSGIAYGLARRGVLIADEMGLGKTVQAIGVLNNLPREAPNKRVLVITRASLLENWRYELDRWLMDSRERQLTILQAKNEVPRGKAWPVAAIASYSRAVLRSKDLLKAPWDLLIVDEAHAIKTETSKQSKALRKIKARRKILLSGSPLLNRPIEIWPLLDILKQSWCSWPSYVKQYCDGRQETVTNRYGDLVKDKNGKPRLVWSTDGQSNLGELQQHLRSRCMIRRLKSEVLPQLPPKRHSIIPIGLDSASSTSYRREEVKLRQFEDIIWTTYTGSGKQINMTKLGQLSKIREQMGLLKAPVVGRHAVEMLESVNKIVVFAHHRSVVAELYRIISEAGHEAVTFTGDLSAPKRTAAVQAFQETSNCRAFIGSIGAASEGLTLTAASEVLFSELPWRMVDIAQAEDRCHRIGQMDSVNVCLYVVPGGLDERMAGHVIRKKRTADLALDIDPGRIVTAESQIEVVEQTPCEPDLQETTEPEPVVISASNGPRRQLLQPGRESK